MWKLLKFLRSRQLPTAAWSSINILIRQEYGEQLIYTPVARMLSMLIEQVLKQIYSNFPHQKVAVISAICCRGKDHQLQVVAGAYTKSRNYRVGPILSSQAEIDALAREVNTALGHIGSDVYNLLADSLVETKERKVVGIDPLVIQQRCHE
ncbi:MAG: hypothetical protein ACSHWQ_08875 [Spongiibacteraceae bacterium]